MIRTEISITTWKLCSTALAIVLAGVLLVQPFTASLVYAQTVSLADEQVPLLATLATSSSVPPLPSASPQNIAIILLREKYKTDLSIYRTDERDFALAKEQFLKLQTLAALEISVKATRKVMITRAIVLQDYTQILSLILKDTSGIDVGEKTALIQDLESMNDRLKLQQKIAEQAIDRESVLAASVDFAKISVSMSILSYKSMSYISYGRLQTVHDKMLTVRDEVTVDLNAQESNGLKLGEKRRAIDEINRNLDTTKLALQNVQKTFSPTQFGSNVKFDSGSYPQTVQSLSTIYADLYRNLSFLREVIK